MLRLDERLHVLDLAAGTGANVRYLTEYLSAEQRWLLIDRDPVLLAEVPVRMSAWGMGRRRDVEISSGERPPQLKLPRRVALPVFTVSALQMDLRTIEDESIFAGRALVTASALLDLVSERWLRDLANRCCNCRAAVLFALSYDGRIRCCPDEPEDDAIRDLVNRHQRTDKGFGGAALGPDAAQCAERCFTSLGYEARRERSDWVLPHEAHELQRHLVEGWARAAAAIAPAQLPSIRRWQSRRLAHIAGNRSRLTVGHEDFIAWPRST